MGYYTNKHAPSGAEIEAVRTSGLLYPEFMRGMCNAPWGDDACGECGGNGLKPIICCNGYECGCRGMPIDFAECSCGATPPTDKQIEEWV